MNPPIVLTPDLGPVAAEDVRDRCPGASVYQSDDARASLERARDRKVLVASNRTWRDPYRDVLSAGDWVTTVGAGYDAFPTDAFAEAGVRFTNSPGINAAHVAEHVFATAFSFSRTLWTYRDQQRSQVWEKHRFQMTDFASDPCCVVGLGHVGEAVCERANAFGMATRGVKRTTEGYDGPVDAVYEPDELPDALRDARLLVLAVPLTADTEGMIGRAEFELLADDAVVVNVARGPVLDDVARRSTTSSLRLAST